MSSARTAAPASQPRRGIPDIEFIKRHVPIADVARALDIRVASNTAAHCWRPDAHEHGDRTPSVWFSRRSNKGKCFVCDRFNWCAAAAGRKGGKARAAMQSHEERHLLGVKAGKARTKSLSAAERKRIAKKAVEAREARRAERRKKQ